MLLTNQEYLWDKDFVQWETTSFVFLAAPDKKVFDFVSCFYTKCYNKQQILLGGVMMKQIIAMGGGGFSMEPDNLSLDQYILNQSKREQPRICFLPTASGDSQNYIQRFYHAFQTLDCVPSHLSLFKPPSSDLVSFVMEMDVIYVGGEIRGIYLCYGKSGGWTIFSGKHGRTVWL